MSEERFTNREITLMFEGINEKLDEHACTHREILDQVKYTNGKLRRLTLVMAIVGTAAGTAVVMGGGGDIIKFLIAFL